MTTATRERLIAHARANEHPTDTLARQLRDIYARRAARKAARRG